MVTFETGRSTAADPSDVVSRDDFAEFVAAILAEWRTSGATEWENPTLDRFLDALAAFALGRVAEQAGQETATWRLFAEMLAAATGYE